MFSTDSVNIRECRMEPNRDCKGAEGLSGLTPGQIVDDDESRIARGCIVVVEFHRVIDVISMVGDSV